MRTLFVEPPTPHALDGAAWNDPPPAGGDGTVLVVPAGALSWHRVNLPPGLLSRSGQPRTPARLRAVLEGLLEDQLLDEPAQLHLSLQARSDSPGPHWVAVCQRSWLRSVMDTLTRAGHRVQRIVPEWAPEVREAPSPEIETANTLKLPRPLWITGSEDAAELVWSDTDGVHRRNLASLARGPAGGADATAALHLPAGWADQAPLWAEPACAALAERLLRREAKVQARTQRLQACAAADWDLASDEFANRSARLRRATEAALVLWQGSAWRPARWALGLLCLVQLAGLNAQAWQAREALAAQRSVIQSVLLTTFPYTPVVVDAALQMQRAVDALGPGSGQAQSRDLERILEAIGAVSPAEPAPLAMEFVAGELRLDMSEGVALPGSSALMSEGLQARSYRLRADGPRWVVSP
ncbi:type II secretion system protein GspL [Rhodoferax sp. OV413]|uniref:type II secretion system protein GspL n=1 Tax=Rhodoferax sp. OV413 TaxID=1855285 RepID=UPI0025E9675F|nr:type II secretion system protein GspL [Rhodoferax sp. OV413]